MEIWDKHNDLLGWWYTYEGGHVVAEDLQDIGEASSIVTAVKMLLTDAGQE